MPENGYGLIQQPLYFILFLYSPLILPKKNSYDERVFEITADEIGETISGELLLVPTKGKENSRQAKHGSEKCNHVVHFPKSQ